MNNNLEKYNNYLRDNSKSVEEKKYTRFNLFGNTYAIIHEQKITHNIIPTLLELIRNDFSDIKKFKKIIVIAESEESFSLEDLLYCNDMSIAVTFFLVNNDSIYYYKKWDSFLGFKVKRKLKEMAKL